MRALPSTSCPGRPPLLPLFSVCFHTIRKCRLISCLDHHTIGKDPELGEAEVEVRDFCILSNRFQANSDVQIWRHIQSSVPSADVFLELRDGTGLLRLRLDWVQGTSPMPKMLSSRGRTPSIGSKGPESLSRFTMMKRREKVERES